MSRIGYALLAALLCAACGDPEQIGATDTAFSDTDAAGHDADTSGDLGIDAGSDTADTADAAPDDADATVVADASDTVGWDIAQDVGADVADTTDVADSSADATDTAVDTTPDAGPDIGEDAGTGGFDDQTVPWFLSGDDLLAYAATGEEPVQCKFALTRFKDALGGEAHFLDPIFYALHDEWYFFRLLNGQEIAGLPVVPVVGLSFNTVAEIVTWAKQQATLPLGLTWYGERLYAPPFYSASFNQDRFFGLGSILHYDPNPDRVLPGELWLFELEFVDNLTAQQVATFFGRLSEVLPPVVAAKLKWLPRSMSQEALADSIDAGGGPLAGRSVRYSDLVVKGEVKGYNPGIAAGKLKFVPKGEFSAATLDPTDIVILEEVPDYLPPVAAIVTAVPQTPLAHLNLLAKSRGTPNVYIAGVFSDVALHDWEQWSVPVIIDVTETAVTWKAISKAQYETYKSLQVKKSFTIPQIDVSKAPLVVDLLDGGAGDVAALVPLCGGKAAGLLAFNDNSAIDAPDLPLCLTIRGYVEHLAPLRPAIEQLLQEPDFQSDGLARFLVLEGEETFLEQHPGSLAWLAAFQKTHGPATLLGGIVAQGGLKQMVRSQPIAADTISELFGALSARYASLSPMQGLRFRSSSTAEDVPGFNGAGLYDSNTGFLKPSQQPDPSDKKKSIGWAIAKTWASYWTFEAFEERRTAGIDHLSGNMALLVHARFDDDMELSNGVVTAYLARSQWGDSLRVVVNAQKGSLSVTNPVPGDPSQPEIDVVETWGADVKITRVQPSSEVSGGELLLDDARLLWLHEQLLTLSNDWLDAASAKLPAAQRSSSLILDLEYRSMEAGWPALASGVVNPPRFVLKQVRTLDESSPAPDAIEQMPIPRDILGKALTVQKRTCTTGWFVLETIETYTDPSKTWAFDYGTEPFNSIVTLNFTKKIPDFPLSAGSVLTLLHTDFALAAHPFMHHGPWDLYLELLPEVALAVGFESFQIYVWGDFWISGFGKGFGDSQGTCKVVGLLSGPVQYLKSLL